MARIHRILFVGFAVGSYSSNASNLHEDVGSFVFIHFICFKVTFFRTRGHENSLEIGG